MGVNRYPGNVVTSNGVTPTVESASGVWTIEEANQNIANWPMPLSQIANSLRFNSADSAYLSRIPSSDGNRKQVTLSFWVKRTNPGAENYVYNGDASGTSNAFYIRFNSTDTLVVRDFSNSGIRYETTQVFRDPSAWYHIVVAIDTTQLTAADRQKIYVNGEKITTWTYSTAATQNANTGVYISTKTSIIGSEAGSNYYLNGYLTEFNMVDGLQLSPDYFGFFDANGIWQPRQYKGSYGTNGFYLPMNKVLQTIVGDYLVVAGGGGGGANDGTTTLWGMGGGGAGGYRSFTSTPIIVDYTYTVTVGAGGPSATKGNNSVFGSISSTGGGRGCLKDGTSGQGGNGGSGGGGGVGSNNKGLGNEGGYTPVEGYNGGNSYTSGDNNGGGGGGGSSAVGANGSASVAGTGGAGTENLITGSSVYYAGGGGGGGNAASAASGGIGGGGAGSDTGNGSNATVANTGGGGGGGGGQAGSQGGAGGSGVVIIKIPDTHVATFSGGVTYNTITSVSGYNIYRVTQTTTTSETVSFSLA